MFYDYFKNIIKELLGKFPLTATKMDESDLFRFSLVVIFITHVVISHDTVTTFRHFMIKHGNFKINSENFLGVQGLNKIKKPEISETTEYNVISEFDCVPASAPVFCVNESFYKICEGGKTIGPVRKCPENMTCVSPALPFCRIQTEKTSFQKLWDVEQNSVFCIEHLMFYRNDIQCPPQFLNKYITIANTGCQIYVYCNKTNMFMYKCPDKTYYNGHTCKKDFICPTPCQKIIYADLQKKIVEARLALKNSGLKRWPIKNTSCKGFVEITISKDSTFRTKELECPHNSWFDPVTSLCRVAYYCRDEPHTVKKCADNVRQRYCDPEFEIPNCYDKFYGNIIIPRTGCRYFRTCSHNAILIYACPHEHFFNEKLGVCQFKYECPSPCKTFEEHTKEDPFNDNDKKLVYDGCDKSHVQIAGAVFNSRCKMFYQCNGTNVVLKECPLNLYFDPLKMTCVPGFKCYEYSCVPEDLEGLT